MDRGSRTHCFTRGMSLLFGTWLLYVGASKWVAGPGGFVDHIAVGFSSTWSPDILNRLLAWIILIAEPVLGAWLISGCCASLAWSATALLMFMLTMGMTLKQEFGTVANNWQYVVLALACATLSKNDAACCKPACGTSCETTEA